MNRFVRLVALLSSLALGASIVRGVAQWQLMSMMGGTPTRRMLVLLEVGNWLGWSAWAVILAAATGRLTARQTGGLAGFLSWSILALAPLLVVPLFSSPWHWLVTSSPGVLHSAGHIVGHNLPTNLLLGVAMVTVAQGTMSRDRTRRLEQTAADLRTQLAESQLAVLRARLDPHFLFNALNSAMVLARRGESKQVERLLEHLSALLRHSLDSASTQVVPLRVELEVLRHYLDIEQVRHGDRLVVRWNVDPDTGNELVPSLVLQPLAENAIRHGFTDPSRPLTIVVSVTRVEERLRLQVDDDGGGLTSDGLAGPAERIGLGHTRARLAGLYGNRATFTLEPGAGGRGVRVTITIPGSSGAAPA